MFKVYNLFYIRLKSQNNFNYYYKFIVKKTPQQLVLLHLQNFIDRENHKNMNLY